MARRLRLLDFSALYLSLAMGFAFYGASAGAFDPNEGAEPHEIPVDIVRDSAPSALPSPEILTGRGNAVEPVVKFPSITRAPIAFVPLVKPVESVAVAPVTPAVPSVQPSSLPPIKLVPPAAGAPLPEVDPAVKAQAEKLLAQTPSLPAVSVPGMNPPAPSGFIAPPPLVATIAPKPVMPSAPSVTMPAKVAAPVIVPTPLPAPVVAPMPEALSHDSKKILSTIPSKIDAQSASKKGKVAMARQSTEIQAMDVKGANVDAYESAGIKISVRRPGLDTGFELNRAYNALTTGDNPTAAEIYKNILSTEPTNADALFGLASTYHRAGQIDKARPLYGQLLKHHPQHREGINNFLVLVSEEAPNEALAELDRLAQRNPNFSPIPAQQAVLLNKLGYTSEAREHMLKAIELAPENMAYKYNLAVMLDKAGHYADAVKIYRMLIEASSRGVALPASADVLQRRLNHIAALPGTSG